MEYTVPEILEASRKSFKFFMQAILSFENPPFLDTLDDVLSDPDYKKIIAAYPRGHGKCLSNQSIILTERGPKILSDIKVGDIVLSINQSNKLEKKKVLWKEESGEKETIWIKTKTGRTVEMSPEHRLFTFNGYKEAKELTVNDFLGTLNKAIDSDFEINDDELRFISHMIFEGGCASKYLSYTNFDYKVQEEFLSSCAVLGINSKEIPSKKGNFYIQRKPAVKLLKKYGIFEHSSKTKRLPNEFFRMSLRQKYIFLGIMFATDGYVSQKAGIAGITLANENLIDDIQYLLATCGIVSSKTYQKRASSVGGNKEFDSWTLNIGRSQIETILDNCDLKHKKKEFKKLLKVKGYSLIDVFPHEVVKGINQTRAKQLGISVDNHYRITREKLEKLYQHFPIKEIKKNLEQDIIWDQIVSIEIKPKQEMIDIQVEDNENFFVNGIVSHNSTHLSIGYPAWRLAQDHNLRIVITSNTAESSQRMLRGIMNVIENNPRYKEFAQYCDPAGVGVRPKMRQFGARRVEENWSSRSITLDRDVIGLKDPSVAAVGLFGSLVGRRCDILIADDIVDQNNSATEEQREKIKDWFYATLLPIVVDERPMGGQLIYLGNTWQMGDLVQDLLNDPQFDYHDRLKSIIQEPNKPELWQQWASIRLDTRLEPKERVAMSEKFYTEHCEEMNEGVKVLWPERMPYEKLYLLRYSNSYAFARMYQCDPASRPDQKFQESWIKRAIQKGKDLILQDAPRENITTDYTTSGLDLAISLEDSADDTVLLTLDRVKYGTDSIRPGSFILRNIHRGKMTPNEVRLMIKQHDEFVQPLEIRVESNAFQMSMVRDMWDLGVSNVTGYKTGKEKNDMEIGVNSLAILLENEMLVLPYNSNDSRTIQLVTKLIEEMRSYPEGHTGDSLMALWFAYSAMRDRTGNRIVVPSPMPALPVSVSDAEIRTWEQKADLDLIKQSSDNRKRSRAQNSGFVF